MKNKSNDYLLDEFEAQTTKQKINPGNDDVQTQMESQAIEDSYQKYADPQLVGRNSINPESSMNGDVSLGDTEVKQAVQPFQEQRAVNDRGYIKSYQYQDPKTGKMIQEDPNKATRTPDAIDQIQVEEFVGGGRKAVAPTQVADFSKQPITVTGENRTAPVVAQKAPDYKPMDFDSLKVQNEARINQTAAAQKNAAAIEAKANANVKFQEADAAEKTAEFYASMGKQDEVKAQDLMKLDEDREFWKQKADAKAPPRGWGERILDGIAVFLGGVGLKGGEPNQVFNFVMNKMEQRSKEFIAEKNNAIEMVKKLNELDPRIKKTPENMQRLQMMWQAKAIEKLAEAQSKKAQGQAELAKLQGLKAKAIETQNNKKNELYADVLSKKEAQKNKEKEIGMLGESYGIIYKPEQIKSPADQARAVIMPDGKSVMLAKTKDQKKAVDEIRGSYRGIVRALQKIDSYMDKTNALGRLWDKMGTSEQSGILQSLNNELLNNARVLYNTGVLNQGEVPILEKGFPSNPTALANKNYMKGLSKGLKAQITNKYKDVLIDSGLVNKKTGKPDIGWFKID